MKVLVSGSSGYVASALIPKLLSYSYDVKGIDIVDSDKKYYEFHQGDIRDIDFMRKQIKGVDTVIHLAAVVPPSPLEDQLDSINVRGAYNLAQLCRSVGVKRFCFASSTSIYGNGKDLDETKPPKYGITAHSPSTSYVSAKVAVENFVRPLQSYTFHPIIFRFATVFGESSKIGWQSLFNTFVKDAIKNKKVVIYHPNAYRPFCHVSDIAEGISKIIELPYDVTAGETYNIGGINATKLELLEIIKRYVPDLKVQDCGGLDIGYAVNFDKIRNLGLTLTKNLEDGVVGLKEALCR